MDHVIIGQDDGWKEADIVRILLCNKNSTVKAGLRSQYARLATSLGISVNADTARALFLGIQPFDSVLSEIIITWCNKYSKQATLQKLADALKTLELNIAATVLEDEFNHIATKQATVLQNQADITPTVSHGEQSLELSGTAKQIPTQMPATGTLQEHRNPLGSSTQYLSQEDAVEAQNTSSDVEQLSEEVSPLNDLNDHVTFTANFQSITQNDLFSRMREIPRRCFICLLVTFGLCFLLLLWIVFFGFKSPITSSETEKSKASAHTILGGISLSLYPLDIDEYQYGSVIKNANEVINLTVGGYLSLKVLSHIFTQTPNVEYLSINNTQNHLCLFNAGSGGKIKRVMSFKLPNLKLIRLLYFQECTVILDFIDKKLANKNIEMLNVSQSNLSVFDISVLQNIVMESRKSIQYFSLMSYNLEKLDLFSSNTTFPYLSKIRIRSGQSHNVDMPSRFIMFNENICSNFPNLIVLSLPQSHYIMSNIVSNLLQCQQLKKLYVNLFFDGSRDSATWVLIDDLLSKLEKGRINLHFSRCLGQEKASHFNISDLNTRWECCQVRESSGCNGVDNAIES